MSVLNKIVTYWYDCIKNEDILEKDISIRVRKKAVLYPFDHDPFIFDRKDNLVPVHESEKLTSFSEYVDGRDYDPYYGYPVLFYFDDEARKYLIAPLFIIRVKFLESLGDLCLQKDEPYPTCGIQAFNKLGFRTEEIAEISQSLDGLFRGQLYGGKNLADKCLEIIEKEAEVRRNEPIDPSLLTNTQKLSKDATAGLYNKSLVFAGDNTVYNMNLLQDLMELTLKDDLEKTALSFIVEKVPPGKGTEKTPVLPFPSNEYQVKALQNIFKNKLSVITGPPGTGKSQYISNLLVNLFLEEKSALFVSHTNEAVDVVNTKINEEFRNLMLRTGRKEFRQDLKGRFNELISASLKMPSPGVQIDQIVSLWQVIMDQGKKLLARDNLEHQFENSYFAYRERNALFCKEPDLEQSFNELLPKIKELEAAKGRLENLRSRFHSLEEEFNNCSAVYTSKRDIFCEELNTFNVEETIEEMHLKVSTLETIANQIKNFRIKVENKTFSLWEKMVLFVAPNNVEKKKGRMFSKLNQILPIKVLGILQGTYNPDQVNDWNSKAWVKLNEYVELCNFFYKYKKIQNELRKEHYKKEEMFLDLNRLLTPQTLGILQNSTTPGEIKDWTEVGWLRFSEYIALLKCFSQLTTIKQSLSAFPPRLLIEQAIRKMEKNFCEVSRSYIKDIYLQKMLGDGENIGKVNSFLHEVNSPRPLDNDISGYLFEGALDVLKIWSSTLKSIRRTFPLSPGIFDYVIFDEASQVDLPSAAPALYRAKRAIVVGDPMQLTHIAGITRDIDRGLAKIHDLNEEKDIYPSRIRYCDVSLYKSAENSLNHKPILLTNHYRSEDQIIALCNQAFYEGRLKIMTTLDYSNFPTSLPLGVNWIDCEGEVFKHPAGSRINQAEAQVVNKVFQKVLEKISETNLSIGIVTPYSRQQDAIYEAILKSTPEELLKKHNVKILTAHKFQGSEKDIMIFSLVLTSRGNGNSDRWYNIYPQILNVALSRAKYLLHIVGDKNFCYGRNGVLKRLVETYDDIKKQEKADEYTIFERFDSPTERFLYERLQNIDFDRLGYKLIPKLVIKRYTLDFALLGKKKINIECDGCQHEIIEGMPVLEDVERDDFLKKEGWDVLRFPNHRILSETDSVVEKILSSIN